MGFNYTSHVYLQGIHGRASFHNYLLAVRRLVKERLGKLLQVGFQLTGYKSSVLGQPLGHGQSSIACEHTYLQNPLGFTHTHQHLQRLACGTHMGQDSKWPIQIWILFINICLYNHGTNLLHGQ